MVDITKQITLLQGDCLVLMDEIPERSIDMIFADLPYGTTNAKWDSLIPMKDYLTIDNKTYYLEDWVMYAYKNGIPYKEAISYFKKNKKKGLWTHYNRIIKDNGAIVLYAQTPFDKILGASNPGQLKYEWIWEKTTATGFFNAKKMPMKAHENLLVFYKHLPIYNPQKTTGHTPVHSFKKPIELQNKTQLYGAATKEIVGGGNTDRYPRSVIKFASDKQKLNLHPTQKPIELSDYMIKTYTNEGMTVLDNCMGSGTTGASCKKLNRKFIGIEADSDIFATAENRILKGELT